MQRSGSRSAVGTTLGASVGRQGSSVKVRVLHGAPGVGQITCVDVQRSGSGSETTATGVRVSLGVGVAAPPRVGWRLRMVGIAMTFVICGARAATSARFAFDDLFPISTTSPMRRGSKPGVNWKLDRDPSGRTFWRTTTIAIKQQVTSQVAAKPYSLVSIGRLVGFPLSIHRQKGTAPRGRLYPRESLIPRPFFLDFSSCCSPGCPGQLFLRNNMVQAVKALKG